MGEAVDALTAHMSGAAGHGLGWKEIADLQLKALDERLQERIDRIKLVKLRAEEAGISRISRLEDVVPLLLPHTAYKSYPESFLTGGKWDRLTKWLGTVSAHPTDNVDLTGVQEIDQWVEACGKAGHFVSCSSGTTGKSAMLVASQADLDFASRDGVEAVQWGSDIRIGDMRTSAGAAGAVAYTPRNMAMGMGLMGAFVEPEAPRYQSGLPPVTVEGEVVTPPHDDPPSPAPESESQAQPEEALDLAGKINDAKTTADLSALLPAIKVSAQVDALRPIYNERMRALKAAK